MPINILDNETVIGTLSSSSTIYDGNGGNSAQWDGAVNNITGLQSLSGNWQSTYATVCALSSNWSAAYASTTALNLSSGKWNNVFTLINTTTATTFNVNNLSATGTVYANNISTPTISANNTYSSGNQYVISDGVGNNNTGNGANTISLNAVSGTYIGSNLTIKGNLSATGNVISSGSWANSVYTGISGDGVLIDYLQGSPGLGRISVGNGTGTDSLAFYSNGPAYSPTTSTLYLSANGLVGINTNAPNQQLTVVGNISATGNLYGTLLNNGTNLGSIPSLTGNWNTAYNIATAYSSVSSSFATNSTVNTLTGLLVSNTAINTLTGNWNTAYISTTALNLSSAYWNGVYTTVQTNSGTWGQTGAASTIVQNTSANWNTAYNIATAYSSVSGTFLTSTTLTNYLPTSGGTITGQLKVNGVVTASGSNVNINVVNTSSNWIFSNADNNKAIHFNTNSSVLTASIPSGLQAGFNVALMNTGTNSVILSSQTTLFASGSSVASGFGGALIYTDSSNNVFAVGRLF